MTQFPQPKEDYAMVYQDDTDKPLSKKVDYNLRYAYFKTIAKGGKSIIKSCKDMHLNRVICYKTLLPEFVDDEIEQQRLLREARVTAMLQHPNTVPTYELGRDKQGYYYFTMKLVHGYTFREILDYRERYDLTQLIDVLIQVGHALEYAHNHGVAHRDIKPENILVGPFGEVLLLDWGLAKVWTREGKSITLSDEQVDTIADDLNITRRGKLQGTVCYMSPEQIHRDPEIDHRTDVYSLGTLIYEVLTGQTAAQGDSLDAIINTIKHDEPIKPSTISRVRIPPLLEEITMACLKKNPDERIQTANELTRLLQEDWQSDLFK